MIAGVIAVFRLAIPFAVLRVPRGKRLGFKFNKLPTSCLRNNSLVKALAGLGTWISATFIFFSVTMILPKESAPSGIACIGFLISMGLGIFVFVCTQLEYPDLTV